MTVEDDLHRPMKRIGKAAACIALGAFVGANALSTTETVTVATPAPPAQVFTYTETVTAPAPPPAPNQPAVCDKIPAAAQRILDNNAAISSIQARYELMLREIAPSVVDADLANEQLDVINQLSDDSAGIHNKDALDRQDLNLAISACDEALGR